MNVKIYRNVLFANLQRDPFNFIARNIMQQEKIALM